MQDDTAHGDVGIRAFQKLIRASLFILLMRWFRAIIWPLSEKYGCQEGGWIGFDEFVHQKAQLFDRRPTEVGEYL
jgi:hypothetical protein